MPRKYRQLSIEERAVIMVQVDQGRTLRAVARSLDRSPSTLSRELNRNQSKKRYKAVAAQQSAVKRRCKPAFKLFSNKPLWELVQHLIRDGWSPQQISGRVKARFADEAENRVSHETIYRTIYALPRGGLRQEMIKALRQKHKQRRPRTSGSNRKGALQNTVSIDQRPAEGDDRRLPGHWEGDLIKGAFNRSAVGTLVERKTRLVALVKVAGSDAKSALRGFRRELKKVPPDLRQTLTYDRGSEMAHHETLAKQVSIDIYFADPYSPWQRGSNENTNGLLRQYLPKGTDLSVYTQRQLDAIAHKLNTRPRAALDFLMPIEAYQLELDKLEPICCT